MKRGGNCQIGACVLRRDASPRLNGLQQQELDPGGSQIVLPIPLSASHKGVNFLVKVQDFKMKSKSCHDTTWLRSSTWCLDGTVSKRSFCNQKLYTCQYLSFQTNLPFYLLFTLRSMTMLGHLYAAHSKVSLYPKSYSKTQIILKVQYTFCFTIFSVFFCLLRMM